MSDGTDRQLRIGSSMIGQPWECWVSYKLVVNDVALTGRVMS